MKSCLCCFQSESKTDNYCSNAVVLFVLFFPFFLICSLVCWRQKPSRFIILFKTLKIWLFVSSVLYLFKKCILIYSVLFIATYMLANVVIWSI